MTLAVVLQGGLVRSVVSDDPDCPVKTVTVIDYDTDDAGACTLRDRAKMVPQDDGSDAIAFVEVMPIERPTIGLSGMRPVTDADLKELGFFPEDAE